MDGQQRTISICRYAAESERTFAVDEKYYFNLEKDLQKQIDDYVLDIYVCDGTPSEVHEWFKVINIAGKPLTAQELRNTAYTGTWLSDAKLHFQSLPVPPTIWRRTMCRVPLSDRNTSKPLSGGSLPVTAWIR